MHLRISQINGCSACVESGMRSGKRAGVSDERLFGVAAWRDSPHFSAGERAALALAEAVTRLADQTESVTDEIWAGAAGHHDEPALAGLLLWIAITNLLNRLNAPTRQVAGARS